MYVYEHDRTKDIVSRLVSIGDMLRLPFIALFVVLIGAVLAHLAEELVSGLWWFGGVCGILIGFGIGVYAHLLVSIALEWMAQLLIAQGEILAALKDDPNRSA